MLPRQARRKADFVVCLLFIAFGGLVLYQSSLMPWETSRTGAEAQWYLSPGLFPAILGILLILFSLRVLVSAVAEGGHRDIAGPLMAWIVDLPRNVRVHRVVFIVVWSGLYIFGALGRVNFQLASVVFVFVLIAVFWLPGSGATLARRAAIAALVSVIVPVSIAHVFSTYLYVPVP